MKVRGWGAGGKGEEGWGLTGFGGGLEDEELWVMGRCMTTRGSRIVVGRVVRASRSRLKLVRRIVVRWALLGSHMVRWVLWCSMTSRTSIKTNDQDF